MWCTVAYDQNFACLNFISGKCRKISLSNGVRVSPSHCLSSDQGYGSTCTFSCNRGFRLKGPSSVQCGNGGVWSQKVNSAVYCNGELFLSNNVWYMHGQCSHFNVLTSVETFGRIEEPYRHDHFPKKTKLYQQNRFYLKYVQNMTLAKKEDHQQYQMSTSWLARFGGLPRRLFSRYYIKWGAAMCTERYKAVRISSVFSVVPIFGLDRANPTRMTNTPDNFQLGYLGPRHCNIGIPPNQDCSVDM